MHVIPPYDSGVFVKNSNVTWQFYESRHKLFGALGWRVLRRAGRRGCSLLGWQTVIKDANGERLDAKAFIGFASLKEMRQAIGNPHPIGVGPVPGTGVGGRGSCMRRRLKTTQERRRHSFYDVDAGEPKPRARRTGSNLASVYDDMIRSDADARNWKHYRKHQWKP
jgi:hypothetical protein